MNPHDQQTERPRRHAVRRAAAVAAAFAVAVPVLSGCAGAASGNAQAIRADGTVDLTKVTLTVGDQKGGSRALLGAAGELDDLPYELEWRQFTSGPPLLEALNAGAIDVGGVGNTPPLFAAAADAELFVVAGYEQGGLGDAIVVPSGSTVSNVADLEGAAIAVAKGSSANYHLFAQLQQAGLTFDDVDVHYLQPADALAAFTAGHVDAWATWDPYTAQAELQEGAEVIAVGKGLVNGLEFTAANPAALEDPATSAAIEDFVARLTRAKLWSGSHKDAWARAWADETQLPLDVIERAAARRIPAPVRIDDEVVASEQAMADAFVEAGLLPAQFDVAPFFDRRYSHLTPAAGHHGKD